MKKIKYFLVYFSVLVLPLFFSLRAHAATVGDTADVKALHGRGVFSLKETRDISIKSSIDIDVVLGRKLRAGDVRNLEFKTSEWSMFKFGYRMFDRIEPYVRLGWAHLKMGWTDAISGTKLEFGADSGFAWGLGVKALIYEFKEPNIRIIGDCSYRTSDLDPQTGYFDGTKTPINKAESRFVIREWQAALLATTEIDLGYTFSHTDALNGYKLSPYGGVKYSEISGRLRLVTEDGSAVYHPDGIKSDMNIGIVVGLDLILPKDFAALNLEGRFIDETAISAGLGMLF